MKSISILLFIILLFANLTISAQSFDQLDIQGVQGVSNGDAAWGDIDNDGDYDLIISGFDGLEAITRLYTNEGGHQFKLVSQQFEDVQQSQLKWADYNKDGFIDLFLYGVNRNRELVMKVYDNQGDLTFIDSKSPILPVEGGSFEICDLNNDSYLDVVFTGLNNGSTSTRIYYPNTGRFLDSGLRLSGIYNGDLVIDDWDQNGKKDILMMGWSEDGVNEYVRINQTTSGELLEDLIVSDRNITSLKSGDLNNDGTLELIVLRENAGGFETAILTFQNGLLADSILLPAVTGTIIRGFAPLPKSNICTIIDFDNDGDLDIVQTGDLPEGDQGLLILHNNGNLSFTSSELPLEGLPSSLNDLTDNQFFLEVFEGFPVHIQQSTWGDYDMDGDMDLITSSGLGLDNEPIVINNLYINNGNFELSTTEIPNFFGKLEFVDTDGKAPLELFISGSSENEAITGLYEVHGIVNPRYTVNDNVFDPLEEPGSFTLADRDNDGDNDMAYAHNSSTFVGSSITIKDFANGSFDTFMEIDVPDLFNPRIEWTDADDDGDFDITLLGEVYVGNKSFTELKVIINENNSYQLSISKFSVETVNFKPSLLATDIQSDGQTELILYGLHPIKGLFESILNFSGEEFRSVEINPTVSNGTLISRDFDLDGDPDLIAVGLANSNQTSSLFYQNDGSGKFLIDSLDLNYRKASAISNDFDLDGYVDLLIQGADISGNYKLDYFKNSSGSFSLNQSLEPLEQASLALVDHNSDDILDIAICGQRIDGTKNFKLVLTDAGMSNIAPSIPGDLTTVVTGNKVTFSWSTSTDDHSIVGNISYNLRLFTESELQLTDHRSDSGRTLLSPGNAGFKDSLTLILQKGKYSAQIQALDGQFASSEFSDTISFEVSDSLFTPQYIPIYINGLENPVEEASWVDFNNDDFLDLIVIESFGASYSLGIYANNQNVGFEKVFETSISSNDLELGDLNNDNLVDILVDKELFKNENDFHFEKVNLPIRSNILFLGKLVDFDNDGFTDINYGPLILRNLGDLRFTPLEGFMIIKDPFESRTNSYLWGDIDGDTDMDLLHIKFNIEEQDEGPDPTDLVLMVNDGDGRLITRDQSFFETTLGEKINYHFVDLDGDSDLDIYYTYADEFFENYFFFYFNDGTGLFTEQRIPLEQLGISVFDTPRFVDFDYDGDLDIYFQNGFLVENKGGTYAISDTITGETGLAWGDFDNDQDLDYFGRTTAFLNTTNTKNTPPSSPDSLMAMKNGSGILLTWKPAVDIASSNHYYSIEVYRNGQLFISSKNINAGYGQSTSIGNTHLNTNYLLREVPDGTYSFRVKAIDYGLSASEFSDFFEFEVSRFEIIELTELNGHVIENETFEAGDIDNDGDLDVLISSLFGPGGRLNGILINEDGEFSYQTLSSIPQMEWRSRLVDMNNDGVLDILSQFDSKINVMLGNGNLSFTDPQLNIFPGFLYTWADVDVDGKTDIIVSGVDFNDFTFFTDWHRQADDFTFKLGGRIQENSFDVLEMVPFDFDSDGDPDLFYSGLSPGTFGDGIDFVNENNGSGVFNSIDIELAGFRGVLGSTIGYGDYDNDHDVDITFRGFRTVMLENLSNGTFESTELTFPSTNGEVLVGDFDGDGDLDNLYPDMTSPILSLNFGDMVFKNIEINIPKLLNGPEPIRSIKGDFDMNGTLDLMVHGFDGEQYKTFLLLNRNSDGSPPSITPENLRAEVIRDSVIISWDDSEQRLWTETYNLHLINHQNLGYFTTHSADSGTRLLPEFGNVTYRKHVNLGNLEDGLYTTRVQGVSNVFHGSEFTEPISFLICNDFESVPVSFDLGKQLGVNSQIAFTHRTDSLGGERYHWEFGDGTSSNEEQVYHSYARVGIYRVTLTITNEIGCTKELTREIEIEDILPIRIANVMTPNGDGKNDFLYIENIERYPNNTMKVVSLAGQVLFSTRGYNNDWFGTYNGESLNEGNYLCILKVDQFSAELRQSFTIIK